MPRNVGVPKYGFSASKVTAMKPAELPEKIKCSDCNKTKPIDNFSEKQQKILRQNNFKSKPPEIRCKSCSSSQVSELKCSICRKTKSLDGFAKGQRRNGENARCMLCVANDLQQAPLEDDAVRQSMNNLGLDDDDDAYTNAYEESIMSDESGVPLPHNEMSAHNLSAHNASVSQASTHRGTKSILSSAISNAGPSHPTQEWQSFATPQPRVTSSPQGHTFTAYDTRGNAHQRTRAASTIASEDSFDTTVPQTRDEATAANNARGGKFAKLRAVPREMHVPSYKGGATLDDDEEELSEPDSEYGVI